MTKRPHIERFKYEVAQEFGLAHREEKDRKKIKLRGKIKRAGKRF